MDYKKIAEAIKLCGSTPKVDQCKKCVYWSGGDMGECIPRMTEDAAAAMTDLLSRAEAAEARCALLDEARENANEACAKWEGMYRMALERAEKAENERNAAVEQLRGLCSACKHYTPYHNDGPCATCTHEVACFAPEKATDKWEWVGIKEE